jgi:glycerol kinase
MVLRQSYRCEGIACLRAGALGIDHAGSVNGVIVGLTGYVHKGHIARAALEATAFQTREVVEAMETDSGVKLAALKVDGGMDSVTREHLYHDWKSAVERTFGWVEERPPVPA